MNEYTIQGAKGTVVVIAASEKEARHQAMIEFWGPPNGKPTIDVDSDGYYLSAGLTIFSVRENVGEK